MRTLETAGVASRFGLGPLIGEPTPAARGANGWIWKLVTDSGQYAVKQLQDWVDASEVPFDVEFQLAAARAGVALPRPVLTPEGAAVVDRVRVYEWVELGDEMAVPVSTDVATQAGEILGRIHSIGLPPPQDLDPWYVTPPGREQWESVVEQATESGQPWTESLAVDLDFLLELAGRFLVDTVGPRITCHRDFDPKNVLPTAEDASLVVLDWENAGPGAADAEVAASLLAWTSSGADVDLDAAAAFLSAYRGVTGFDTRVTEQSFSTSIVTHLNFLKVMAYQAIHDDRGNREFALAWLPHLVPDSLRSALKAIETLVSAEL